MTFALRLGIGGSFWRRWGKDPAKAAVRRLERGRLPKHLCQGGEGEGASRVHCAHCEGAVIIMVISFWDSLVSRRSALRSYFVAMVDF